MSRRRAAALLAGAPVFAVWPAAGQQKHITAFTGEWRYVAGRSRFDPGPPFRAFVLRFTPDGTRHLDLTFADGRRLRAELPWSDGRRVKVRVIEGDMQGVEAVSRIRGRVMEDTWFQDGRMIEKVRGRISRDGRTLTVDVEGPLPGGGTFRNQVVFERQDEPGKR
ncbi:MAG: hypothetical protein NZR01_12915 [Bryobacteraceae bacterium]|nr:hypothetical protein [Bryobacteraceae bacterium]